MNPEFSTLTPEEIGKKLVAGEIKPDELSPETIQTLIEHGIIESVEDDSIPDESPGAFITIDGWEDEIELTGLKLPVLTVGSPDTGILVFETKGVQKMSKFFRKWMQSSESKRIDIRIVDHEDTHVEKWRMQALPEGIGWGEVSRSEKTPWLISVQMSVRSIFVD